VLDTTLCDKVCQLLVAGLWFSPVSSTNKIESGVKHHNPTLFWQTFFLDNIIIFTIYIFWQ
jgi:hypothetical protein